jgi:hypothetical protein
MFSFGLGAGVEHNNEATSGILSNLTEGQLDELTFFQPRERLIMPTTACHFAGSMSWLGLAAVLKPLPEQLLKPDCTAGVGRPAPPGGLLESCARWVRRLFTTKIRLRTSNRDRPLPGHVDCISGNFPARTPDGWSQRANMPGYKSLFSLNFSVT